MLSNVQLHFCLLRLLPTQNLGSSRFFLETQCIQHVSALVSHGKLACLLSVAEVSEMFHGLCNNLIVAHGVIREDRADRLSLIF